MSKKIILGFAGEIAAGKGTCADYLKARFSAETFRFSTPLFDIARRFHLPADRDTLQRLSSSLRKEFGEDLLAKIMFEDARGATANLIVIDGVRRLEDVKYLRELPDFKLCYISAPMRARYERMVKRGEKADDATKTFEEFEKDHQREAERGITQLEAFAADVIDNSGSLPELHAALDAIVGKYGQ
jgi:dephospho-CoA kinase